MQKSHTLTRHDPPPRLQIPHASFSEECKVLADDRSQVNARGTGFSPVGTPGLSIGLATPYISHINPSMHMHNQLSSPQNERESLEKDCYQSQSRTSSDKSSDYFSSNPNRQIPAENLNKVPTTLGTAPADASAQSPLDQDKEEKSKESMTSFKKKFRMNFPKKLGRSSAEAKPIVPDEKSDEKVDEKGDEKSDESDKSEGKDEKGIEDNFFGTIQNIRKEYEEKFPRDSLQPAPSLLEPNLPYTELLKPPPHTTIIIQEDQPDSGGVADLYQGTVQSLGQDADLIERTAPMWLGELLLRVYDCFDPDITVTCS